MKVNGGAKALRDLAGNAAKDTQWSFRTPLTRQDVDRMDHRV